MLLCPGYKSGNTTIESIKHSVRNEPLTSMSEDDVLRLIEQAVIDNRLPPGTKLKEVQLAEVFGVKRGTIRKVLARLAHSKLVDQLPNRGASVARPSVKEGRDLFAARRAIERANLEILIQRISAEQISQLRQMLEQEQQAYHRGDIRLAVSLSVKFHQRIASMAGNTVLKDYLDDIIKRTPLVILTHLGSEIDNRCRNQEHEAIVDAIAKGDTEAAVLIMDQHLAHIEDQIATKPDKPQFDLASLLLSGHSPGADNA